MLFPSPITISVDIMFRQSSLSCGSASTLSPHYFCRLRLYLRDVYMLSKSIHECKGLFLETKNAMKMAFHHSTERN